MNFELSLPILVGLWIRWFCGKMSIMNLLWSWKVPRIIVLFLANIYPICIWTNRMNQNLLSFM